MFLGDKKWHKGRSSGVKGLKQGTQQTVLPDKRGTCSPVKASGLGRPLVCSGCFLWPYEDVSLPFHSLLSGSAALALVVHQYSIANLIFNSLLFVWILDPSQCSQCKFSSCLQFITRFCSNLLEISDLEIWAKVTSFPVFSCFSKLLHFVKGWFMCKIHQ